MAGGEDEKEGRVEICSGGLWGTICGVYGWDINDATVVCRQLGYQNASKFFYYVDHHISYKLYCSDVEPTIYVQHYFDTSILPPQECLYTSTVPALLGLVKAVGQSYCRDYCVTELNHLFRIATVVALHIFRSAPIIMMLECDVNTLRTQVPK